MFVVVYLFVNRARKSLIALAIVAVTLAAWASLGGPRGEDHSGKEAREETYGNQIPDIPVYSETVE